MTHSTAVDAVILAGSRPGRDRLADHVGLAHKALVPVAGKPLLAWPLQTLLEHPGIRHVTVLAQDPAGLLSEPGLAEFAAHPRIRQRASLTGISESLALFLNDDSLTEHVLVTTADNALLDAAMIDHFLAVTAIGRPDVAAAMVERRVLLARYPQSQRTWLKARGGAWSGANLFWLRRSAQVTRLLQFWQSIEKDRKRGMKIVGAFGPLLLIGAVCRLITLPDAIVRAGRRFGLNAQLVAMPQAEACIDVDKPEDMALVEDIMAKATRAQAEPST